MKQYYGQFCYVAAKHCLLLKGGKQAKGFENMILRGIFWPKWMRISVEGFTVRNFVVCTFHLI
jgi:hypothetical protein